MNSLFDLSNLYGLACNIWPRFPYDIPQLQTALKPFLYLFNITNQCNLNCYYCCQKTSLTRNRPELSFEDIAGIIKKLPRYAVIVFSGGEPLCRDDFTQLLQETRRLKRKAALLTNGLLLNDDIIREMIQNRLLKNPKNKKTHNLLKNITICIKMILRGLLFIIQRIKMMPKILYKIHF